VLDPQCVAEAVAGKEAVVVALGSHDRKDRTIRSEGTANVIRAMKIYSVPRLVVVSAGGVGDSYQKAPLVLKALIKTMLSNTYADHEQQERTVRDCTLEWVIVRPAMLTDGPATGRFQSAAGAGLPEGKISRADLACFVLQQVTNDHYLRQAVSIP
jgi:putative NADH-flavin reductase